MTLIVDFLWHAGLVTVGLGIVGIFLWVGLQVRDEWGVWR